MWKDNYGIEFVTNKYIVFILMDTKSHIKDNSL